MHAFFTTEILNNWMWVATNYHVTLSQSDRQGLQASSSMDENDNVKLPSATRQINVSRVDRTMKSPAGTATRKKKSSIKEQLKSVLWFWNIWAQDNADAVVLAYHHHWQPTMCPWRYQKYHIQFQFYEQQARPNRYQTDVWFISLAMKIS